MNAEKKVIKQKLSVLELAKTLGNISAACRQKGGLSHLVLRVQAPLPPIAKHHPNTTPPETVEKIKGLAMAHPSRGPNYLEADLKADGIQVSLVTIQKILERAGLGSRYDRWLAIEKRQTEQPIELSGEQVAFIEKQNPQFKKRHLESSKPGELLNHDTFFVGAFKGVGRVYMHVVVDTWCSYAFEFLHVSKQSEAAVAVLHNDVLLFYKKHRLKAEHILTDNGREFCGTENHPYQLYLELNDIKHRRSTGPCSMSFSESSSGKRCTSRSMPYRKTSINGSNFTMNSARTWATEITEKHH